jgi:hypothetical protein
MSSPLWLALASLALLFAMLAGLCQLLVDRFLCAVHWVLQWRCPTRSSEQLVLPRELRYPSPGRLKKTPECVGSDSECGSL